MSLNYAMTNKEARPHFIKSYKGMRIPAFDELLYTEKDGFRVLRWVMEKGIDLQGFRMEVGGEKGSGRILHGLMVERRVSEVNDNETLTEWVPRDEAYLELARCYATRGRLTDVDEMILDDDEGEEIRATALTRACRDRHVDIVKGLLAAGADCNKSEHSDDGYHCTPLMLAAIDGHVDLIDVLVAAGADVDKVTYYSPLSCAAMCGQMEAAKALLKAGADTEAVGTEGRTPIHWAARNGRVEVLKLLMDAGANKEEVDDGGDTPLMIATDYGEVEVVKVLLAAGVDLKRKNTQGETALVISKERYSIPDPHRTAVNQGREQITTLLVQAGAKA